MSSGHVSTAAMSLSRRKIVWLIGRSGSRTLYPQPMNLMRRLDAVNR
jgi:hypothetical protein